ncbi:MULTISPECIES: DUF943 family protein [Enterobacteriaceae]|jgi:hypothetical protein|uniref:DUF943 family protein n=1 Tax=Enterobacteriaceae TaxID=543 RepID=UPI0011AA6657|nr:MULTISPECIES: DUF943 family protein [Enterobacteriaceae]
MNFKGKKNIYILSSLTCIMLGYLLWLLLRPVKIVDVHKDGDISHILVKSFPLTDKGKINWWLENEKRIKIHYNLPQSESQKSFTVIFWDFGNGYKEKGDESKDDRFCFSDLLPPKNCIDKSKLFYISSGKDTGISFVTDHAIYRIKKDGELVKMNSN